MEKVQVKIQKNKKKTKIRNNRYDSMTAILTIKRKKSKKKKGVLLLIRKKYNNLQKTKE